MGKRVRLYIALAQHASERVVLSAQIIHGGQRQEGGDNIAILQPHHQRIKVVVIDHLDVMDDIVILRRNEDPLLNQISPFV